MSFETIEMWDHDLDGHDPLSDDPFWSLNYEFTDNRVHPMDFYRDGELVSEHDYKEVFDLLVDLAYIDMQKAFPHPSQEFSGAWTLPR